jgi:hypothetical protein
VALQSGRLWVSYQNASSTLGEAGGINLADPTAPWDSVPAEWIDFPPAIAVDTTDTDTGILVTSGDPLRGGTATATYNVSDPSAVTLIDSSTSISCGNSGLSVLRGGKSFLCDGVPYSAATLVTTIYPARR